MSLPVSNSLKLFQKKNTGRTRYGNTKRSRKGDEDTRSARLKVRLFQGAMEADTSLMTTPYPADSLADCTKHHELICVSPNSMLPPPSPVCVSNKSFHKTKLRLWGFFQVSVLGKSFSNEINQKICGLQSHTHLKSWLTFICIFYQTIYSCFL